MNSREIILSIDKPCNADWNSMTLTPEGKHCGHCSKKVLDVTHLQPEEIFTVLKQKNGNVCMRLRSDAINSPIRIQKKPIFGLLKKLYYKAAVMIGLKLIFMQELKAQVIGIFTNENDSNIISKKYLRSVVITGTVSEKSGQIPIEFVQIAMYMKDTLIGSCLSNEKGEYALHIKDSIPGNSPVKLVFTSLGHHQLIIENFILSRNRITIETLFFLPDILALREVTVRPDQSSYDIGSFLMGTLDYHESFEKISTHPLQLFPLNNTDALPRQSRILIDGMAPDLIR